MSRIKKLTVLTAALCAFLTFAGIAHATGGNYVFDGGTPAEQEQVRSALEASSFDWGIVEEQITIKIAPIGGDYSVPGTVYLDSDLLDSPGDYSWGVVQNEYANEVDFYALPDEAHATFNSALGGTAWCYEDKPGLPMIQYGCERFASTLAWAYWQSADNSINPADTGGISGHMAPAEFKALLTRTLGVQTEVPSKAVKRATKRGPAFGVDGAHITLKGTTSVEQSTQTSSKAGATSLASLQIGVLAELNKIRRAHGLVPLTLNASLTAAVTAHSDEMLADGYFAHSSADGSAFWKRIQRYYAPAAGHSWSVGENLLWYAGPIDAKAAVKLWMASPDHRANILDGDWREIGIVALSKTGAPAVFGGGFVTVISTDFGVRS